MDSGNSSSMQSSSGGADPPLDHQEYDSTPTSLHFDFNTTTTPPPPPPHHQHMPPHILIPQPPPPNLAAGDHLQQTPTTTTSAFIHPHMMMDINNPTNVFLQQPFSHSFTTSTTSWTSTTSPPAPTSSIDPGLLDPTYISFHPPPSSSSILPPNTTTTTTRPPKNPRKRSRASRRAPTTVLTTDTSNFRAMVQEFTGIPASHPPPSSSPYSRLLSSSFNSRPPSPHTPIFPDPFFSFLQHPHQHQLPAPGMQGYMQQLPFTNPPFGPTHHHIPRDIAIDPLPVVDCIHDRGVNQVITSTSSCGASTDFLAQQGDNAEQGNQHK